MNFDRQSKSKRTFRCTAWEQEVLRRRFVLRAAMLESKPVRSGVTEARARAGRWKALVAGIVLMAAVAGWACSVPVFRYALERWPADVYHAVIFHRGALTQEQAELARQLNEDGLAGELFSNVKTHLIDLDADPPAEWVGLWLAQRTNALPWLALMYPPVSSVPIPLWTGPLANAPVPELLNSPARREIADRLIQGQSAVWVFLEMGDEAKDDAAVDLLSKRLEYLTGVLKLPTLEQEDIDAGLVSVGQDQLRVAFSIVRVARDDPAEALFARMLLGTEDDLKDLKEPMAFPVFGRGRALYALVGQGINHETIDEACAFLIGACSCQVKELNPGVDLLLSADWDHLIETALDTDRELPPLTGLIGFDEAAPMDSAAVSGAVEAAGPGGVDVVEESPGEAEADAGLVTPSVVEESPGLLVNVGVVVGLGLLVIGGASLLLMRRGG